MKKIEYEVAFINTKKGNPRNGEGDFLRLKNGDIMFAYASYDGNSSHDHGSACIRAVFSKDNGESFDICNSKIIAAKGDAVNVMCVSLMRMANGDLGMFYGLKYITAGSNIGMTVMFTRSIDEGATWSAPIDCVKKEGYYVFENARVIRLNSGRILIPLNLHRYRDGGEFDGEIEGKGHTCYFASDDDGYTFFDTNNLISHPFNEMTHGLQETGIVQFESGKIFSFSRTANGSQFESFSEDDGMTWSVPMPSTVFFSPASPMHIRHMAGRYTAAVFNPIPNYPHKEYKELSWGRTPLVCLIAEGDGSSFWDGKAENFILEDDPCNGYCYPVVFDGGNYFLAAYYHSNNSGTCLNSCKIVKIPLELIDEQFGLKQ